MDGRGLPGSPAARIVIRPEDLQGAARLLTRVADPRAASAWLRPGCCARTSPSSGSPPSGGPRLAATTEEDRFARAAPDIAAEVIQTGRPSKVAAGTGGPVLAEPVAARSQDRRRAARPLAAPGRGDRRGQPRLPDDARRPGGAGIERDDLAEELARQAETDPLTGVREPARPGASRSSATSPPPGAPGASSPSRSSTSTTSRPSTTPTATRRATCSCATPSAPGASTCARATCWRATAARSSSSCCPRPARPPRRCARSSASAADAGRDRIGGRRRSGTAGSPRRISSAARTGRSTRPSATARDRTVLAAPLRAASRPSS